MATHRSRAKYETVLGVDTLDDVVTAARRVRESGKSERVATYRAEIDGDEAPLGVLVQRLINADAAGVMFTANPVTGDNEIVIEAVSGLGDMLIDGGVDGERWIVGKSGIQAGGDAEVLDEAAVTDLAELARQVTRERGAPQDIEWAIADGEIHLLQARPITGLPVRPQIEFPPGRWMKDTSHFAGPITPAGATILLPAYEAAFAHTFEEFGMPLETILQRSFGGEVYTQDVDVGHDPSAPPPWRVLAIAVRLVPAMRRRMKAAEDAIPKLESYPRRWESTWRDECIKRIEAARAVDPGAMSDDELLDELQRLIDDVLIPHLTIHFQMTMPHMIGVYELNDCCQELLGWDTARTMELLTGLSTATTAATRELRAVAAQIDGGTLAGGMEAVRTSEAAPGLEAWLQHWGLRTIDVDPGAPMTAERDALVLKMLRQTRTVSDDDAAWEQKRQDAIAEPRERLSGAARKHFDGALAYAELVYPQRDDNVPYTEGLPCGLIRRASPRDRLTHHRTRCITRGRRRVLSPQGRARDRAERQARWRDGSGAREPSPRRAGVGACASRAAGRRTATGTGSRSSRFAGRRSTDHERRPVGGRRRADASRVEARRGRQPARHRRVPRQLHGSCTRHQNGGGARPTTAGRRAGVPDDALELDRGVRPSGRAGYRRWRHAVTPVDHRTRARHPRGGRHRLRNRDTSRGTDGDRRRDHRTGADPLRVFGRARQITVGMLIIWQLPNAI